MAACEIAVFEATCSMHSLRTLNLGSFHLPNGMVSRILHHLGSLTFLETLHNLYIPIEIQSFDGLGLILSPFGTLNHWFLKLQDLSLSIGDFDSAALIMDSMHLPFLSLAFYLRGQSTEPHCSPRKLLQSLGRNPHLPLSLSSINILGHLDKQSSVCNVGNVEAASIFQPLLALTNLQKLSLRLSGVEMLDDAWPNRASKRHGSLRRKRRD